MKPSLKRVLCGCALIGAAATIYEYNQRSHDDTPEDIAVVNQPDHVTTGTPSTVPDSEPPYDGLFTSQFVLSNLAMATPLFIDEMTRKLESASAEEKGEILTGIGLYIESLGALDSPIVSEIVSLLVREIAYRDFPGWTQAYGISGEAIVGSLFLYEVPLTEAGRSALEERLRMRQNSFISKIDILLSGIHDIEGARSLIDARYNDFNFEAEMLSQTAKSTSSQGFWSKWKRNGSLYATAIKARQGDEEAVTRILRAVDHMDLPKTTLHRELLDLAIIRRDEFASFLVPYVFSDEWASPDTVGIKAAWSPARTLIRMYSEYPFYDFYRDALEIDPVNVIDFSVVRAQEWVLSNVPRDVLESAGVVSP